MLNLVVIAMIFSSVAGIIVAVLGTACVMITAGSGGAEWSSLSIAVATVAAPFLTLSVLARLLDQQLYRFSRFSRPTGLVTFLAVGGAALLLMSDRFVELLVETVSTQSQLSWGAWSASILTIFGAVTRSAFLVALVVLAIVTSTELGAAWMLRLGPVPDVPLRQAVRPLLGLVMIGLLAEGIGEALLAVIG